MLFNSITFICFFLPITLAIYYAAPKKVKSYFLLTASIFFYFWGGGRICTSFGGSGICQLSYRDTDR